MDYYDMEVKLDSISFLKDSLWGGDFGASRSSYLSPIYIERIRGVLASGIFGYHKFWEIACVISGEGRLRIEKQDDIPIVDSRIFLIPPDIAHTELTDTRAEMIWIGCKGDVFRGLPVDKVLYTTSSDIAAKSQEIWNLSRRGYGHVGMELDGRCLDILGCFQRHFKEGKVQADQNIIEKAVAYINEHFADDLDISELASKFNCSEGHFYRLFKKRIGLTPVSYISKVRVQNAAQWLLRSDIAVSQIANLVGYRDQFYFSRVFRKIAGTGPKSYREKINRNSESGR